jgi:hypothetical protein
MGRTVIPGVDISARMKEMPACFFGAFGSVRASTKIQSANCPRVVQVFWPLMM